MAIYQVNSSKLEKLSQISFASAGLRERQELQMMLKQQVDIICSDVLVISEEFGDWEDSRRRIDLLAIDKSANLVVIELKRTDDGGHMELQAIRYAAMVANLTFDKVVEIYQSYLDSEGLDEDARNGLLTFLGWDEPEEDDFCQDVRLVLVSSNFSKEITSTVLWLNEKDLDIQCVRMIPYEDNGRLFIDIQKIIPLPETQDYQVKVKEKNKKERIEKQQGREYGRYNFTGKDIELNNLPKRRLALAVITYLFNAGVSPKRLDEVLKWRASNFISEAGYLTSDELIQKASKNFEPNGTEKINRRYFLKDDELVQIDGKTYAISKRWGPKTEQSIAELEQAFPEITFKWERIN